MKKLLAVISAAALCAVPYAGYASTASADSGADIVIAASDELPCNDIFDVTKAADSDMWTYTMIYDRLFDVDAYGFRPALAKDWGIVNDGYNSTNWDPDYSYDTKYVYDSLWEYEYDEVIDAGAEYYSKLTAEDWACLGYKTVPKALWLFDFFDPNEQLILYLSLRNDIYFADGEQFTSQSIVNLIDYAKSRPNDTLIYNQWAAVSNVEIQDEFHLELYFDFSSVPYGFMDFMYGTASPMGSIVKPPENESGSPIGTGAYIVSEAVPNQYIKFKKNREWWNGSLMSDTIAFVPYVSEYLETKLYSGEVDMGFANKSEMSDVNIWADCNCYAVTGNPIILKYNLLNYCLMNDEYRMAIDYTINNRIVSYYLWNATKSNDFWMYKARYDPYRAKDMLVNAVTQLNVLGNEKYMQDLELFQCYFGVYYNDRVTGYDEYGNRYEPISISITTCSEDELKTEWETGDYDIYFEEIDLWNINPMMLEFGNLDSDSLQWMDSIKYSANKETYFNSCFAMQRHLYDKAYISYLGWSSSWLLFRDNIYGFSMPSGLNTISEISRLDFRYVHKGI